MIAGAGQSLINLPTQTLIADRIPTDVQGRVYGAHFAWSHLWWAFSYPLAVWMGSNASDQMFLYGGLLGLLLLLIVQFTLSPRGQQHESYWHDHEHVHDEAHQHEHYPGILVTELHTHPHQHTAIHH